MPVRLEKETARSLGILPKARVFPSADLTGSPLAAVNEDDSVGRILGFLGEHTICGVAYLFSGTTSYTPPDGVTALIIECWGGGGAGGGAQGVAATFANGGGGGAGAYSLVKLLASVIGSHIVAIGAGGTAGTAGNNPGNAGGDTSFKDHAGTIVCLANGGSGGSGDAAAAAQHIGGLGGAGGLASGGTGDIKVDGSHGDTGISQLQAAAGGNAYQSGGGAGQTNSSGTGANAPGYGGGGGSARTSGGASVAGGTGGAGLIIVWELI